MLSGKRRSYVFVMCTAILIISLTAVMTSCDKEYQCDCYQDVMGIDTTYSLVGHGRDAEDVCNAFDSETTEFGITKTVDCEPY